MPVEAGTQLIVATPFATFAEPSAEPLAEKATEPVPLAGFTLAVSCDGEPTKLDCGATSDSELADAVTLIESEPLLPDAVALASPL